MTIEFQAWPKISRLNRDITITEKIDGTNAAIGIAPLDEVSPVETRTVAVVMVDGETYVVWAQSRKRLINPGDDNFGFAMWVWANAIQLAAALGPGLHYGEWWGKGIQRGYGLDEKRFSLFNTKRWLKLSERSGLLEPELSINAPKGLDVVPVLYEGPFNDTLNLTPWDDALNDLRDLGSQASPGFMSPEGIVIYHHALNGMFKVTLQGDEAPKSRAA